MPSLIPPVVAPGALAARQQPVLHDDGLVLRPWVLDDAPSVARAYTDPDVQRWHARTMDEDEARAWVVTVAAGWRAETRASWAVSDGAELLGRMELRTVDLAAGTAEVAYWVVPAARGRGVARRALQTMSRWAFDELGLHRLQLHHAVANIASCAVAEAAAFPLEGVARSAVLHADGWHDMHVHARITGD